MITGIALTVGMFLVMLAWLSFITIATCHVIIYLGCKCIIKYYNGKEVNGEE